MLILLLFSGLVFSSNTHHFQFEDDRIFYQINEKTPHVLTVDKCNKKAADFAQKVLHEQLQATNFKTQAANYDLKISVNKTQFKFYKSDQIQNFLNNRYPKFLRFVNSKACKRTTASQSTPTILTKFKQVVQSVMNTVHEHECENCVSPNQDEPIYSECINKTCPGLTKTDLDQKLIQQFDNMNDQNSSPVEKELKQLAKKTTELEAEYLTTLMELSSEYFKNNNSISSKNNMMFLNFFYLFSNLHLFAINKEDPQTLAVDVEQTRSFLMGQGFSQEQIDYLLSFKDTISKTMSHMYEWSVDPHIYLREEVGRLILSSQEPFTSLDLQDIFKRRLKKDYEQLRKVDFLKAYMEVTRFDQKLAEVLQPRDELSTEDLKKLVDQYKAQKAIKTFVESPNNLKRFESFNIAGSFMRLKTQFSNKQKEFLSDKKRYQDSAGEFCQQQAMIKYFSLPDKASLNQKKSLVPKIKTVINNLLKKNLSEATAKMLAFHVNFLAFKFPDHKQLFAKSKINHIKNDIKKRQSGIREAKNISPTKMELIALVNSTERITTNIGELIDECDEEYSNYLHDRTYTESGDIIVSPMAMHNNDTLSFIIAHEIGHNIYQNLTNEKQMSQVSLNKFKKVSECLNLLQGDVNNNNFTKEDFSDLIAMSIDYSYKTNPACILIHKNYDDSIIASAGDIHSSSLLRMLRQEKLQNQTLPAVCESAMKEANESTEIKNCFEE